MRSGTGRSLLAFRESVVAADSGNSNVVQAALGACSAAFAPCAGYVSDDLTSLYDNLTSVLNAP